MFKKKILSLLAYTEDGNISRKVIQLLASHAEDGHLPKKLVVKFLTNRMKSSSAVVRNAAVEGLWRLAAISSLAELKIAYAKEKHFDVRQKMSYVIGLFSRR